MTTAPGATGHVRRISHVVVNVTDLDRSVAFYEAVSSLRQVATTSAPEQSLAPLPLDDEVGSYRGAVLEDPTGGDPVAVHLVEWLRPAPIGQAIPTFMDHGIVKLGIAYPDPEAKRAQLEAAGAVLTNEVTVRSYFTVLDPDGVIVSFLNFPGTRVERLFHTCLSTISVADTVAFYRDVVGLDHWMNSTVPGPVPASQGPGADVAHFDSNFFRGHGDRRFSLDCSKSLLADPASPATRPANQVGIARVAIEVSDIDAVHARIQDRCAGQAHGPRGEVVTWKVDDPIGERRVSVVADPNGHLLELYEPTTRPFVDRRPDAPPAP